MSSSQHPIKKIKITTDHHHPIDRNTFIESQSICSSLSNNTTSSSNSQGGNINESIQILNLVNSIDMFRDFTISKATDILLTAKKQNYTSGSVIIDLENKLPSNSLYIVVNGKISLINRSQSQPSSPKSSNEPLSPPIFPISDINNINNTTTTTTTTNLTSSQSSIKKRKRENSFLKQQQQKLQQNTLHSDSLLYTIQEENSLDGSIDEEQVVFGDDNIDHPHCCFQSGDHFCENSYPSNLFIAETDVELIKFNQNDFQFLFNNLLKS